MTLQGLPDWGRPLRLDDVPVWASFEQPGVVLAPCDAVAPAGDDGTELRIDVYSQDRPDTGIVTFGLATVGFRLESSLDRARSAAGDLAVRPAPVGSGLVRLTAPADLGLPAATFAPQPFFAAGGRTATTTVRLDGTATDILVGAVELGLRALGAVVWVELPGVAVRCPGHVTVDVGDLLAAAHDRWPATVPVDDLADWLADGAFPAVRVSGAATVGAEVVGAAVRDRLLARFGALGAPPDGAPRPAWTLPAAIAAGTETTVQWDLADAAPAPRVVALASDPVRVTGSSHVVVHRHAVPAFHDGRHTITVRSTVPPRASGVLDVSVDLTAPPVPPFRPFAVHAATALSPEPSGARTVQLRLGPRERLGYQLRATTVLDAGSALVPLTGPVRTLDDPTPVVTPADLGVRFLPVDATRSLLAVADVVVTLTATVRGTPYRAELRLDPQRTDGHLALPDDAAEPALVAVAVERSTGRAGAPQPLPVGSASLDLFAFDAPPWSATPPPPDPPEPPMPTTPATLDRAGLRLLRGGTTAEWTYAPLTAGVAPGADGRPQFALVVAGSFASLSVTTALRITDGQLDEATRSLAGELGLAPEQVVLRPAPFHVADATLLVGDGTGTTSVLATTGTSGSGTHDAAFSLVLTAEQAAAVKQAAAGDPGHLAVRYTVRVPGSGAATPTREPAEWTVTSDAGTWGLTTPIP